MGDGYGKRLWLFHLYFLLRDDDEARSFIDWYAATFPNDGREVCQCVCWALILHRLGREDEAVYRLVRGIAENLPAVATVVGDHQGLYGIWGEEVMELTWIDSQIVEAMTDNESTLSYRRSNKRRLAPTVISPTRLSSSRSPIW